MPPGASREPPRARCGDPAPDALRRAVEQLNVGELFEQHETLELLWRATAAPVRDLYHGILQVGVGLHHWTRGNHHGANVLLEEGIRRLAPFVPECQGVDVAALVRDAAAARERLLVLGPERIAEVDARTLVRVRLS
ncbi:MAG TPA: DUF309 domain-containing protein [Candidatus Limnocylindria bacterium]|nr:DUF309 domain-containing protein [Candidatus Limnocylindria bacterium]